ncbi:hypothetical protein CSPX01_16014 [Colletotrichum filicis]|nr:hypothetical protein CSPX01_16014 [Colletotrichum filicis]
MAAKKSLSGPVEILDEGAHLPEEEVMNDLRRYTHHMAVHLSKTDKRSAEKYLSNWITMTFTNRKRQKQIPGTHGTSQIFAAVGHMVVELMFSFISLHTRNEYQRR